MLRLLLACFCMSVFAFAGLGTNTSALCMPVLFLHYSLHGTLFSLQPVYFVGMCECMLDFMFVFHRLFSC